MSDIFRIDILRLYHNIFKMKIYQHLTFSFTLYINPLYYASLENMMHLKSVTKIDLNTVLPGETLI